MPCLSSLVANGTAGELSSYAPLLSPMLWTTIATGHHPDRHGVHGFADVDPKTGNAQAVGSATRRTKALWNILSEQGRSAGVVGWMASFPAEAIHGEIVTESFAHAPSDPADPWLVTPGSVYPPALVDELGDLRLRPQDVDAGLLGLFLPGMNAHELAKDPSALRLLSRLAQLYSLHNAAVALVARKQPDFLAVYFHFLDLICHEFVMYHPPRHPRATTAEYERYKEVVGAAYRVQDALLGDLLRHCAPDTGVLLVSDHGFTTGARRPLHGPRTETGLTTWLWREGIAAARGPGVVRGGRMNGVKPHDIAPTVLHWLGLPVGEDMPGRVLAEMFETASEPAKIPSWETEPAATAAPPPALVPEANEQARLTRRFIELGYLDLSVQAGGGGEQVADQNREHVGFALRDLGRAEDALPWLHEAALADPESPERALELARCLLELGLPAEAARAARAFFDHGDDAPGAPVLRVQILIAQRQFKEAGRMLEPLEASEHAGQAKGLRRLLLLRSGQYKDAREAFLVQLRKTPELIPVHLGLADACLGLRLFEEAVAAARRAVELDRGSALALWMLAEAIRRRDTRADATPASWDDLAANAQKRAELRRELREREQARLAKRHAWRSAQADDQRRNRAPILVVSGAPRSGTSMMMRMLAMAGVPVLTDGVRVADPDNAFGYFEWEPIKRLRGEPALIAEAEGKAVKAVSAVLATLPQGGRYEVIFMRRHSRAIWRSQEKMVARRHGEAAAGLTESELERHVSDTLAWAKQQPNVRLEEFDYDELLDGSEGAIERLIAFVGLERMKRATALRTAIKRDLRHHESQAAKEVIKQ